MITQKLLQEILSYDPETGIFRWRSPVSNRVRAGEIAGSPIGKGYWNVQINRKLYKSHRLAWLYVNGEWPIGYIDHINRDKADNRICNLRMVNKSENMANAGLRASNTSGLRGVTFSRRRGKWMAQIMHRGKHYHLGYFDNISDAGAAYQARFDQLFPEISASMENAKNG